MKVITKAGPGQRKEAIIQMATAALKVVVLRWTDHHQQIALGAARMDAPVAMGRPDINEISSPNMERSAEMPTVLLYI